MSIENELNIVKKITGVDDNRIDISEIGWTSRAYIIDNGKIVFKFPRNAKLREVCRQEVSVLKILRKCKFSVKVPLLDWTTDDNTYFGYYGIEGHPLKEVINDLSERQKIEIGTQIGKFVKQFHEIKYCENLKKQTLEEQVKEYQEWFRKDKDMLLKFFSASELKNIHDFFEVEVPKSMVGSGELVLCHGDLDYNNTLINSQNQVGIIDFGDAGFYDRSQDFRGIDDEILREAMIKAYGKGNIISKVAVEATSKMIAVLNMLYYIENKDSFGIDESFKIIKSKF